MTKDDSSSVSGGAGSRSDALRELAARLELGEVNLELFDRALTHSSIASNTRSPARDYESLEFLGDAALGLAVAHHLYICAPDRTPGEYSRMRAGLVNRRCLARVAHGLQIAPLIRLGKGEEHSGGRERISLLADCLEAMIGAVYLDQGWEAARAFVIRVFQDEFERERASERIWDFKSRLQNYCQAQHMALPEFRLIRSEGPDHLKEFEMEVALESVAVGRGIGMSKKEAEQNAARVALKHVGVLNGD
ncbi:MAG: ribonuclease III [Candidatus Hydrogenedentes bacterium]|nr:ribonuclease III [Candidatus Hydrogenedentota bacterium]